MPLPVVLQAGSCMEAISTQSPRRFRGAICSGSGSTSSAPQRPKLSKRQVAKTLWSRCVSLVARGVGGKTQGSDVRWQLVDNNTRLVETPGWTAGAAIPAVVAPLAPGAPLRLEEGAGRPTCNVCLSSGFLAFAAHAGFLAAVEAAGYQVVSVMGTSAGAITGSLYSSGMSPYEVAEELSRLPPKAFLGVSPAPYRGLLTLRGAIERLRELLPDEFPTLPRTFSCGVVSSAGKHIVLSSGSLPEAVAASAAVPLLFCPVDIPGRDDGPFIDGGKADRVGLEPWLQHCAEHQMELAPLTLVHVIARSSPFSGPDAVRAEDGVFVIKSPKSGESLLSLQNFKPQFDASYAQTTAALLAAGLHLKPAR